MAEHIDKEIEAIKVVLHALEPLPAEVRANVLRYVLQRLQIAIAPTTETTATDLPTATAQSIAGATTTEREQQDQPIHIKIFKEQKKPKSANDMAALVAYYLANMAPKAERKNKITAKDIETYFKIAEFPLTKTQFTLSNAKAAGYLDAVGDGEYKLNAVGHNLIVHSMPRDSGVKSAPRRRIAKKAKTSKKR